jgi:hypothetical protein
MSITISPELFSRIDTKLQLEILSAMKETESKSKESHEPVATMGKVKKVSASKGQPTPYSDFAKKVMNEHKDDIEAFKLANPEQKGPRLVFVANYKKSHTDEYNAFLALWKKDHGKTQIVSIEFSHDLTSIKRGPKKLSEMTPDQLAAHNTKILKRNEAKNVKAAGAEIHEAMEVIFPTVVPSATVTDTVVVSKPKRIISDEQKAKMKLGRERKLAEKNALATAAVLLLPSIPGETPINNDIQSSSSLKVKAE